MAACHWRFRHGVLLHGLMLKTREQEEFLVLNGTQTQSAKVYNLVGAMEEMQALGVHVLRISPQSTETDKIVALFDAARHGRVPPAEAQERMQALMPDKGCNGYWYGQPGLDQIDNLAVAA